MCPVMTHLLVLRLSLLSYSNKKIRFIELGHVLLVCHGVSWDANNSFNAISAVRCLYLIYYLCQGGYIFIIVGNAVCLLRPLRENYWTDLHEIFREGLDPTGPGNNWLHFGERWSNLTPHTRNCRIRGLTGIRKRPLVEVSGLHCPKAFLVLYLNLFLSFYSVYLNMKYLYCTSTKED